MGIMTQEIKSVKFVMKLASNTAIMMSALNAIQIIQAGLFFKANASVQTEHSTTITTISL